MRDAAEPRIVGRVRFVDGVTRDVHEDADCRRWVVGYDGEHVYGLWLVPADEPLLLMEPHRDRRRRGR
jgi:hypothetical protein